MNGIIKITFSLFFLLSCNSFKLAPGEDLSNLVFKDIKDKTFQISDIKSKYLLISFLAPWCKVCINELPDLASVDKKINVSVLFIVEDASKKELDNIIKENNLQQLLIVHDTSAKYKKLFKVKAYPETFLLKDNKLQLFLSKNNNLTLKAKGVFDWESFLFN